MNKHKYVQLVIALCLWLPLQAIAGQLVHCAQLESQLNITASTTSDENNANADNQTSSPCHQKIDVPDETVKTCKHCQFVCHLHFAILIDSSFSNGHSVTSHLIPFNPLSPKQPLLPQIQKPPRLISHFYA
ncbi:hypothetical protein [Cellvibrio sp. pealriver]|uniref:hypothetical protein n=1 Tax=Cellvibrio sp. pealriver TaxID=1622269 RepID=UPI00066FEDA5|nr:hypothetical protein [Cellvibrio sp. pealriver]